MTLYSVFLLPLIALAMVVFFPHSSKNTNVSTSWKSRRRRKLLLWRLTIVVLLVATVVSLAWRWEGFISLVQGILLSALVLVPALLINAWVSYRSKHHRRDVVRNSDENIKTDTTSNNALDTQDSLNIAEPSFASAAAVSGSTSTPPPSTATLTGDAQHKPQPDHKAKLDQAQTPIQASKQDAQRGSGLSDKPETARPNRIKRKSVNANSRSNHATHGLKSLHESTALNPDLNDVEITLFKDQEDSPAEVEEQLDRVSDAVQSHDLSDWKDSLARDDNSWQQIRESHDKQSNQSTELITSVSSSKDLSKLDAQQINQLVTTLTKDKLRLQKLVIAQQAAIESERQAHDQSRTVARDAIKIMRDARDGQKFAEKLARRERTERKRVEQQYKSVAKALDNALSIIETRKKEQHADRV